MFNVIGTPIGNMKDITYRAVEVLSESDIIIAETPRVSKNLLDHYSIQKKLVKYSSTEKFFSQVFDWISEGKKVSLISDAGMPTISDPGNILIEYLLEKKVRVSVIPGVSAVTSIIAGSGMVNKEYLFLGFLPTKKGRQTALKRISDTDVPVVVYESPHRILKLISELVEYSPKCKITIGRELTKKFEEILSFNDIKEAKKAFKEKRVTTKGEFVLVIKNGK